MPSSDCDSEALQAALDRYRTANGRRRNRQDELTQYLKELQQAEETENLETAKKVAEVLELLSQTGGAIEEKSRFGGLESAFKALGLITQAFIDDIRARNERENRAERLRILRDALRVELEEEEKARDKAGVLLDAYWECTERLAPKRARFQLDLQTEGGFLGIVARSEIGCTGEGELRCTNPCVGTIARLWRWLEDPTLAEEYQARGELTLSIPLFLWTSAGAEVKANNVTHQEDGGPLSFDLRVRWLRGKPDQLDVLYILPAGKRMQHVRGEISVFGHGQSFSSDQDLMSSVNMVFRVHAEPPGGRQRLSAGSDPSATWRSSDAQTHAWGRSALDVTITR